MRKGLKGEKKDEWLEKIEKEGCRCENKKKWTDRIRCGWRDGKRGRDTERWRFSHGNWPIFLMNAYERRAASHLCSGTKNA